MLPADGTAIIRAPSALHFLLSGAIANGMTHCIGAGSIGLMNNLLLPIRNSRGLGKTPVDE